MPPLSSKIGAVSSEMSPRLRVLHAIHDFLPRHQAGSELYAAALGAALQRRGHHVTVLAAEYDPARPHGDLAWRAHDGLPVVEVVNNWTYPNAAIAWSAPDLMRAFEHVLEATDPDVLHVHSLLNLSLDLPALARRRGIPVVATLHDYTLVCPSGGQRIHKAENHICHTIEPERCARCFSESPFFSQMAYGRVLRAPIGVRSFSLARRLARAAPGLASRLARTVGTGSGAAATPAAITARLDRARTAFDAFDLVVAPSASLATEFQQLGFPAHRVRVMDYGFAPLTAPAPGRRPSGPLRAGFIGSLVWHKGVHVLVEAIRRVPAGHVEAIVFGDLGVAPDYAAALKRAAEGWPVHFRGPFEHREVARALAEIDVLVVPSIWLENSPLVIHEAFMARVPVVGARIGGIADLIQDGVNGVLYPPDSADALAGVLTQLATDRGRLDAMAARAPAVTSLDDHAAEWEALYLETRAPETQVSTR
jgi:glycosyltransferase involved in cell wall biosynthesis